MKSLSLLANDSYVNFFEYSTISDLLYMLSSKFCNADNNEPIEIKKIDLFKKYSVQELNIYKEDDICVTPLGYNQLNRPDVNTIFGKKIVGNIEFYKIDTFKNIRKYLKD